MSYIQNWILSLLFIIYPSIVASEHDKIIYEDDQYKVVFNDDLGSKACNLIYTYKDERPIHNLAFSLGYGSKGIDTNPVPFITMMFIENNFVRQTIFNELLFNKTRDLFLLKYIIMNNYNGVITEFTDERFLDLKNIMIKNKDSSLEFYSYSIMLQKQYVIPIPDNIEHLLNELERCANENMRFI